MKEAYRLLRRIKERVLLRLVFVLGEDRRVFSCVRSPRRMNRVDIFYYEIVPLSFVAPNVDLHAALARSRLVKRESRISVSFATSLPRRERERWVGVFAELRALEG